jgi:hypothetical protein
LKEYALIVSGEALALIQGNSKYLDKVPSYTNFLINISL